MQEHDFRVAPLGWDAIGTVSDGIRSQFGLFDEPYMPVMELVEGVVVNQLELCALEVCSSEEMGDAEGYTCPQGSFIRLREDVYRGAWANGARDRFTVAHEFGHWMLHTNTPLARIGKRDNVPAYERAEPQANQFAAELLMPRHLIFSSDEARVLVSRFGVSWDAACFRLNYIRRKIAG